MAFLLAATASGAGKTIITLGLLAALCRQGLSVQPFKCGPDFIDPTLHRMVSGQVSRNLDLRMCGEAYVRACFDHHRAHADISVVEGVMGLFDGGIASPAALAKALNLPVILVVDAKGCAESMAAVVKGFESLDPALRLAGVIFNRVASPRHLELLSCAVRAHCRTPILGSLPREPNFCIPERHLGLMMGAEQPLTDEQIEALAQAVTQGIDLKALQRLVVSSRPASQGEGGEERRPAPSPRPRIAVARDRAFCFTYQDNLDLLEALGAELVPFSPLDDAELPPQLDGIVLGGGYPELYAEVLAANLGMLAALKAWSAAGRPMLAECGGFITLCQGIETADGHYWPLAGVFPCRVRMGKRLARLGYREAAITRPCLFGDHGLLFGHEFHYSEIEAMPSSVPRVYRLGDGREEGYQINHTLGGYLHLHFGQTPWAAQHFIDLCRRP